MRSTNRLVLLLGAAALFTCSGNTGGNPDAGQREAGAEAGTPSCPSPGIDEDKDGHGLGCPAGGDCNDKDPIVHDGAKEYCDGKDNNCDGKIDEGVLGPCGTCDLGCKKVGANPFPLDAVQDPGVKDVNGVGLDGNGDLVLDKSKVNFNFMWIANTFDTKGSAGGCAYANDAENYNPALNAHCRGTVSKIDTVNLKEVARYFTVTCHSKAGVAGCLDLHGKAITKVFPHAPSRTAIDYNFDMWVANRAFAGQASATKIANDTINCVDRNGNGSIDTSADRDSDGKINVDCDGDGQPDGAATVCTGALAGKQPEFLGDDDECILFTVNYGDVDDMGRSICLDTGVDLAPSNAWVGTYNHTGQNRFYKIDGMTGQLSGPFDLPAGHHVYGCVVDSQRFLWSSDLAGSLAYLNTMNPAQVGAAALSPPWTPKGFYGITSDDKDQIWLGGWESGRVYRYQPDRTSFATLDKGVWTGIKHAAGFDYSRGIAADIRGKVWVAINNGKVWRVDQAVGVGEVDGSAYPSWPTKGDGIIGVGVDFAGHIWGISYNGAVASRLDVDSKGDPLPTASMATKFVPVGFNPYTYSDFTGYGLQNFTRPTGRYLYQMQPCPGARPTWKQVRWTAITPAGTSVTVRVRSGDTETTLGSWFGPYQQSPALLEKGAASPLKPNPALILQVELNLQTSDKQTSPIVTDLDIAYDCVEIPK